MGYKIGAKVITNVNAFNDPNSSPKVHFFAKKVLQTYTFGMFAKLVMSSGRGIFPIFGVGSKQYCREQYKDSIFAN